MHHIQPIELCFVVQAVILAILVHVVLSSVFYRVAEHIRSQRRGRGNFGHVGKGVVLFGGQNLALACSVASRRIGEVVRWGCCLLRASIEV